MKGFRVKVRKKFGDFDKALDQGFAVNTYRCSSDEMWLSYPCQFSLIDMLKKNDWRTLTEIEES